MTNERTVAQRLKGTLSDIYANKLSFAGLIIIGFFVIVAILFELLGTHITPYNPYKINLSSANLSPSLTHIFGTDGLGRDIFSRILAAIPIDLAIPSMVVGISVLVGLVLGSVAGFYRGTREEVIMRFTDLFLAFPGLIMALAIAATLGPSLINATIAITIVWWPPYVRIVRAGVLEVSANDFVTASRAMNLSFWYIFKNDLIPNIIPTVIVYATMDIGTALLTLSTLGFLGVGIPAGTPELGLMASSITTTLYTYPWEGLIPAAFILLIVLGLGLLGEGLRDSMDVNLKSHIIRRVPRPREEPAEEETPGGAISS
ncbi:MAG: ABC transporter permease [Candidatus Thermoplasmatota archaeon]|nr:ABC transporter permease [Candidatus Thermoplasmatota archaeon]